MSDQDESEVEHSGSERYEIGNDIARRARTETPRLDVLRDELPELSEKELRLLDDNIEKAIRDTVARTLRDREDRKAVTDGGVDQSEAEIEQTKEEYSDVLEFTTAETTEMNLDTDHVKAKVEADLGMKILQDGRFMGLSVSTLTGKNPRVSTFLGLTPSQAREIAAALNEAADNAEAVGEKSETPDDSETVFGRIKEAIQ